MELPVPWEENMEEVHERKRGKYGELEAECQEKGWRVSCQPFELGCRGYLGNSSFISCSTWSVWNGKKEDLCDSCSGFLERLTLDLEGEAGQMVQVEVDSVVILSDPKR